MRYIYTGKNLLLIQLKMNRHHVKVLQNRCRLCGKGPLVNKDLYAAAWPPSNRNLPALLATFSNDDVQIHPPKKFCTSCLRFLKNKLAKKLSPEEKSATLNEIKAKMFVFEPHTLNCIMCLSEDTLGEEAIVGGEGTLPIVDPLQGNEGAQEEGHLDMSDADELLSAVDSVDDVHTPSPPTPSTYRDIQDPKTPRRTPIEQQKRTHHTKPIQQAEFYRSLPNGKQKKIVIKVSKDSKVIENFSDTQIAELFMCTLCRKVCDKPVYASCGHMYCQVCLDNLKSKSNACWKFIKAKEDEKINECMDVASGAHTPLEGVEALIHSLLALQCEECSTQIRLNTAERHKQRCIKPRKKQKINLISQFEEGKSKGSRVRKDMAECIKAAQKYAEDNTMNITDVGLNIAFHLSIIEKDSITKKQIKMIMENKGKNLSNRLTAIEAAAMRKGVDLSKGQYERLCIFTNIVNKREKKHSGKNVNIFPHYKKLQQEDRTNLPGSSAYELRDIGTNELLESHQQNPNPKPRNLMDGFDPSVYVSDMPQPNMVGCAYPLTDVLATELSQMEADLRESLEQNGISDQVILQVILKQNEDGIGDLEGIPRMRSQQILPTKVFRVNCVVLRIFVEKENGEKVILYRNKIPNGMFYPTILNSICDESDSFCMKICGDFLKFYREKLANQIMVVNGLRFIFHQWVGRDGKLMVRMQGSSGPTSQHNCARCFVEKDEILVFGEPRTPRKHNHLATLGQINPNRLELNHSKDKTRRPLYDLTKGCAHCGISSEDPANLAIDELHMDLNIADRYETAAIRIMATCVLGEKNTPETLKWTLGDNLKNEQEGATRIWKSNIRKVTGFLGSAKKMASNPGVHARSILNKELRHQIFKVVPDCGPKEHLMKSMELFDPLRKVYKSRDPADEEKNTFKQKAIEFWSHMEKMLPWIPPTNLIHILVSHIPEYFKSPFGTGNLLDLSSSGLELSNKQLRAAIKQRSFKGDCLQQMEDTLRHSCLAGCYMYNKILNRNRVKSPRHCKICKSTSHMRNKCPGENIDGAIVLDAPEINSDEEDLEEILNSNVDQTTYEHQVVIQNDILNTLDDDQDDDDNGDDDSTKSETSDSEFDKSVDFADEVHEMNSSNLYLN